MLTLKKVDFRIERTLAILGRLLPIPASQNVQHRELLAKHNSDGIAKHSRYPHRLQRVYRRRRDV